MEKIKNLHVVRYVTPSPEWGFLIVIKMADYLELSIFLIIFAPITATSCDVTP